MFSLKHLSLFFPHSSSSKTKRKQNRKMKGPFYTCRNEPRHRCKEFDLFGSKIQHVLPDGVYVSRSSIPNARLEFLWRNLSKCSRECPGQQPEYKHFFRGETTDFNSEFDRLMKIFTSSTQNVGVSQEDLKWANLHLEPLLIKAAEKKTIIGWPHAVKKLKHAQDRVSKYVTDVLKSQPLEYYSLLDQRNQYIPFLWMIDSKLATAFEYRIKNAPTVFGYRQKQSDSLSEKKRMWQAELWCREAVSPEHLAQLQKTLNSKSDILSELCMSLGVVSAPWPALVWDYLNLLKQGTPRIPEWERVLFDNMHHEIGKERELQWVERVRLAIENIVKKTFPEKEWRLLENDIRVQDLEAYPNLKRLQSQCSGAMIPLVSDIFERREKFPEGYDPKLNEDEKQYLENAKLKRLQPRCVATHKSSLCSVSVPRLRGVLFFHGMYIQGEFHAKGIIKDMTAYFFGTLHFGEQVKSNIADVLNAIFSKEPCTAKLDIFVEQDYGTRMMDPEKIDLSDDPVLNTVIINTALERKENKNVYLHLVDLRKEQEDRIELEKLYQEVSMGLFPMRPPSEKMAITKRLWSIVQRRRYVLQNIIEAFHAYPTQKQTFKSQWNPDFHKVLEQTLSDFVCEGLDEDLKNLGSHWKDLWKIRLNKRLPDGCQTCSSWHGY